MKLIVGDEYILDSNVPAGWKVFRRGQIKCRLVSLSNQGYVFETPHGEERFNTFARATYPEIIVKHLPVNLENV